MDNGVKVGCSIGIIIFILGLIVSCCVSVNTPSSARAKGDGINDCTICGKSPVVGYGYCKSCFNNFIDWVVENE